MIMILSQARDTARAHIYWCQGQGINAEKLLENVEYQGDKKWDWITAYDVLTHHAWVMTLKMQKEGLV